MSKIKEWIKIVDDVKTLLIKIIAGLGVVIAASFTLYNTYFDKEEVVIEPVVEILDSIVVPEQVKEIIIIREQVAQEEAKPTLKEEAKEEIKEKGKDLLKKKLNW